MASHIAEYLGEALGERLQGGNVNIMKDMVAAGFAGMGLCLCDTRFASVRTLKITTRRFPSDGNREM